MSDTSCKLSADIRYNCENPPIAGSKDWGIILPLRNIAAYEANETNNLIVESITKVAGTRGFEFVGEAKMIKPNRAMVKDDFGIRYNHSVEIYVMANDPVTRLQVEKLSKEREGVAVILKQNYAGIEGNAKFIILGLDVGMRVQELEDAEGRNIWRVMFASEPGMEEPRLERSFFDTSLATTIAAIEDLIVVDTP